MTADEIRASIRARGFEADTDAQQLAFINTIQRRLAAQHRGLWTKASTTVAVTAGGGDFTLPAAAAAGHITSLKLAYPTADTLVEYMDPEELLSERAALNGRTGTPTHWAITGPTTISLYPAATGAGTLTVRYHRVPPTLTAGSDVPILPEMYHELLVIGAAMLMASRERQSAAYGDMQTEYNELSRAFRAQTGIAQQQTPRTIGRSGLL